MGRTVWGLGEFWVVIFPTAGRCKRRGMGLRAKTTYGFLIASLEYPSRHPSSWSPSASPCYADFFFQVGDWRRRISWSMRTSRAFSSMAISLASLISCIGKGFASARVTATKGGLDQSMYQEAMRGNHRQKAKRERTVTVKAKYCMPRR